MSLMILSYRVQASVSKSTIPSKPLNVLGRISYVDTRYREHDHSIEAICGAGDSQRSRS